MRSFRSAFMVWPSRHQNIFCSDNKAKPIPSITPTATVENEFTSGGNGKSLRSSRGEADHASGRKFITDTRSSSKKAICLPSVSKVGDRYDPTYLGALMSMLRRLCVSSFCIVVLSPVIIPYQ